MLSGSQRDFGEHIYLQPEVSLKYDARIHRPNGHETGGRQMANTILLPNFWNNIAIALIEGLSLLGVFRLIDGE
ncbi:hypothetical protein OSB04_010898 [Centaurea solstitialis]|uniref:Uncharacterized protein n=1 Tax=Centaurea solstitialis TaxID=347529 RepID=A0AA38TA50_9ASTR|nr:hypothetical protein OSB04_010898 [Centaurea solstitialis]